MSEDANLRIMIIEVDEDYQKVLINQIKSSDDAEVVGTTGNEEEAFEILDSSAPDIVLIDIDVLGTNGLQLTKVISQRYPKTKSVILSEFPNPDCVEQALTYGAKGFFVKGAKVENLRDSLREVMVGRVPLDPQPQQVVLENLTLKTRMREKYRDFYSGATALSQRYRPLLPFLAQGLTDKEIGQRLHLSRKTVNNYVLDILALTHCNSRTDFAFKSLVTGVVSPDERPDSQDKVT